MRETGSRRRDDVVRTAWMLAGYAARIGLQAVSFILLARLLGATGFGEFSACVALATFLVPVVEFGAYSLAVQDVARGVPTARTLGNSLALALVTAPVGLAILLLAKPFLLPDTAWTTVVTIAVASFAGYRLLVLASGIHVGHGLLRRNAVLQLGFGGSQLLAVLALQWMQGGVALWSRLYLAQNLLAGAASVAWVMGSWGRPTWSRAEVRARLRPGAHFAVASAAQGSQGEIDKLMLSGLVGLTPTGLYSAAHRIVSVAYLPISAVMGTLYPRFFAAGGRGAEHARALARRVVGITVGMAAAAAAAIWLVAPWLHLALGEDFSAAVTVLRSLALVLVFQAISMPFGDALTGSGRQSLRSTGQVCALVLSALLNLSLIPRWGVLGAAWSAVAAQAFLALFMVAANTARRVRVPATAVQDAAAG